MSGAAMTAANMLPVKLPVDRLIALEMAKVVPDGAVQPRYWGFRETLAQAAGVSVRTVQRSLDRLQALGAIIHQGIDGGRRAVRYLLAFALPNWPATSAKMARDECQNGTHRYNGYKKEVGREASESRAREQATPPAGFQFHQEGQAQPVPPPPAAVPAPPPAPEPAAVSAPAPEPAAVPAPPPAPEPAAERPVDLSGWRPDEAGIALALAKGATDIDAEVATFIACHERRGTRLERLDSRWRSWCERIVTFGPNGRRDAPRQPSPAPLRPLTVRQPVTIEVDALDGEAQDGTGQPSEGPAATTAVALPEPSAEAAGSADGRQTDADLAVARVAALWDLSKRPAGFAGELRDAFAGYPGPVLEQAINQVRAEVPYPITVADFTTRANALMAMPELFDPRRQQAKQREREADEAARCAAEAAAAVRAREQRERDAERKAGRILAGVAAEQRERVRLVALVWALAKPDYGTCLLAVHACAVMALAMHDPDAARELTYRGLAARNGHGDDPEFPALPDGLPDEPFRLFQAILKEN